MSSTVWQDRIEVVEGDITKQAVDAEQIHGEHPFPGLSNRFEIGHLKEKVPQATAGSQEENHRRS